MFSVGEKVKFLNEEGEAIILKLLNKNRVLIEDANGFSLQYPIAELVSAERDHRVTEVRKPVSVEISKKEPPVKMIKEEATNVLPELSLAFASSNTKQPEIGDLELFFINSSNYTVLINISAKNGEEWYSIFHGEVKVGEQQSVLSFRRQDVGKIGNLIVDVLFFRNSGYTLRIPINCTLKLKATRFVKNGNYLSYKKQQGKLLVVPVKSVPKPNANITVTAAVGRKPRTIEKPALPQFEGEVDLHLEKLAHNYRSLPDYEKLKLQLQHFEKKLNYALQNNYVSITFIHGVGKGKLKAEIRLILKEYNLRFEDGAYHLYGVGATVVHLTG